MTRRLLACALVVGMALMAMGPARLGSFIYDDQDYVLDNPAVVGSASPWTTPLGAPSQALWRPLTVATFRAQWDGSPRAAPFLVANMLLHAGASVLLLASRLGLGAGGSLLAALLFAAHPVHAEAVAWVSGRAELLAALFVLAAWLAHLSERRAAPWVAALLLALALLSKENALLAPALFAIADVALGRRAVPWRRLALLAFVATGAWLARLHFLPHALPEAAPFGDVPLTGRGLVALGILGRAFTLLAWPLPQRIFYPRDEFLALQPATLAVLVMVGLAALLLWRRQRLAALALLLVPVSLLTVLNLVPIGATFALRFLYLPSAFFCLAVGALIAARGRHELASGRGLGASLAVTALTLGLALPACRSAAEVFHDDLALWTHEAAVAPWVAHARYNHGYFLDAAGRSVSEAPDRPGAEDELLASLRLDPGHLYAGSAEYLLGNIALRGAGRATPNVPLAAQHYRDALAHQPALIDARINLASIAVSAPEVVGRGEALVTLAGLASESGLRDDQRRTVAELRAQLAGTPAGGSAPPPATGTSSPDGS